MILYAMKAAARAASRADSSAAPDRRQPVSTRHSPSPSGKRTGGGGSPGWQTTGSRQPISPNTAATGSAIPPADSAITLSIQWHADTRSTPVSANPYARAADFRTAAANADAAPAPFSIGISDVM